MPKKKYNWSEFTLRAAYKVSREQLYKLWTDEKQICKWFLIKAKYDLRKNGKYEWTWLGNFTEGGKVLDVRNNSYLKITFAGCKLDVQFKKDGKGSLLILRQYNIPTTEKFKVGTHLNCIQGWVFFLTNLKSVIESGKDLRERNPKHLKNGTVFY